jgi:hypothetical protein
LVKTKGVGKGLKMYGVIEFEGGGFHYMESLHYALKPKSFRDLKQAGLPSELLQRLKPLKGKTFKRMFPGRIRRIINKIRWLVHFCPTCGH